MFRFRSRTVIGQAGLTAASSLILGALIIGALIIVGASCAGQVDEDFETDGFSALPWYSTQSYWVISDVEQHSGSYSARPYNAHLTFYYDSAGRQYVYKGTDLAINRYTSGGTLTFSVKVSPCSRLRFVLGSPTDDRQNYTFSIPNDCVWIDPTDGWAQVSIVIPAGDWVFVWMVDRGNCPYYSWDIFIDDIVFPPTELVALAFDSFLVDDDNLGGSAGNGNGQAEPDETIELIVKVKNNGNTTAHNVQATLSTTDPQIALSDSVENYGDIAPGATGICVYDYDFHVDPAHPGGLVPFHLNISCSEGSATDSFQVQIHTTYSIDHVVAHWVNGELDPNDPCQISLVQILQAIGWWAEDAVVPYTGGQTIDLLGILDLIGKWANDTCIESTPAAQSAPRSVPLSASQSADIIEVDRQIAIDTTRTEDRVTVTVTLTAKQPISGLALEENLPEGWSLIPIDNAGAAFKEEASQWLWLTVAAGDTLTVRYQLELPPNATLDVLHSMTGTIRAALPLFEFEISGYAAVPIDASVPTETLEVIAFPNPVRDIHTVTFQARGERAADVEALRVEIYDLAAQLLYRSEENGASLEWHTESLSGDYLANGVYVYKASLFIDGAWRIDDTRTMTVLR